MINVEEAIKALTQKPLKSTSFQRIEILHSLRDKYAHLPQPTRFAEVMRDLLEQVDTPIESYDLIAGRCPDKELSEQEERLFQDFWHDGQNLYRTTIFDTGHCTLDWKMLIDNGFPGVKSIAERSLAEHSDEEQRIFLRGVIGFYDAMIAYTERYARAAEQIGNKELAETLYNLTRRKPETFREGLQLCWLVALVITSYVTYNPTLCVGRLDLYLYDLFERDLKNGVMTEEEAAEYITDYYCKHNLNMGRGEHQLGDESNMTTFERIFNFDAPQYMALAGTDDDGKPAANRLTQLMVDCIVPRFKNPVVVIRYYKGMNKDYPELWNSICGKALESSSMMIYNDNDVISAFENMGIPTLDAGHYEHFGCNWASLGQNSCWMNSAPFSAQFYPEMSAEEHEELKVHYMRSRTLAGLPGDFMDVVREIAQSGQEPDNIEIFYKGFFDTFTDFTKHKLEHIRKELEARRHHPSRMLTVGDCTRLNPIVTATAQNSMAAKYYFEIHSFMCFATVADCFTAIDQLVIREKKITLKKLIEALDANFEGYDDILAMCRNAEKFGSDGELSNYHAHRLIDTYVNIVKELASPYTEKYNILLLPTIQTDTWNIKGGKVMGATPDGRLAGEPFSQNSRPSFGACTNGLTGMLSSLLHLPFEKLSSGSLNLDIQPQMFKGESGRKIFENLLSAYLNNGGLHSQVSCLSVCELEDAKLHPENHRDLLVRVTGYSGVFVDMGEKVQDYVIERMKQ